MEHIHHFQPAGSEVEAFRAGRVVRICHSMDSLADYRKIAC